MTPSGSRLPLVPLHCLRFLPQGRTGGSSTCLGFSAPLCPGIAGDRGAPQFWSQQCLGPGCRGLCGAVISALTAISDALFCVPPRPCAGAVWPPVPGIASYRRFSSVPHCQLQSLPSHAPCCITGGGTSLLSGLLEVHPSLTPVRTPMCQSQRQLSWRLSGFP